MLAPSPVDSASLESPDLLSPPDWDGPRCEKCAAPNRNNQLVCKACGYYASLGTFVALDADWESVADGTTPDTARRESPWETVQRTIPAWAWLLLATNLGLVVAAIVARCTLPVEGMLRTYVSVTTFIVGLVVLIACHATCFIMAASTDVDMGVVDMVVKPLKAWVRTFRHLPARLWLVLGGSNGATASLAAALIIGGIPFHVLLDWNIKQPPKQNLMGAVMAQAQNLPDEGKDNLEDAVGDLAGKAGGITDASSGKPAKPAPAKPRQQADCLVVGYNLDSNENISQLLLATDHNGKLVYAGQVRPRLEPREERELREKLQRADAPRSFVATENSAAWVQPRFTCRVTFEEVTKTGRLTQIEWDSLLGELNIPW